MTLEEAQRIFSPDFLSQLDEIYINGNFGDAVMNPDTVPIVEYFRSASPTLTILISTNGGARNHKFWRALAAAQARVIFCIDGLEDTHSLYRQNTLYSTVIDNACAFINAGGHAEWKMIDFDHNRHQQDSAKELSQQLGFKKFMVVNYGRDQAPVFDRNQQLSHVIGKPAITEFKVLWKTRTTDQVLLEDIVEDRQPAPISCAVKKQKSIYISSTGHVYPCCFLGFNPESYGHGTYHQAANSQFKHLIEKNHALTNSLSDCIQWFNNLEKTWNIPSFEQGRLVICNDVCGQKQ